MKINVQVDLSAFFNEEDEMSFSDQIKQHVVYSVKNEVLQLWKNQIGTEFSNKVKVAIDEVKNEFIENELKSLFENAKVKKRYDDKELISIPEYAKEEFERLIVSERQLSSRLDKITRDASEAVTKELKDRYDLLFASSMVSKMGELGMLKSDVASLIIPKNT